MLNDRVDDGLEFETENADAEEGYDGHLIDPGAGYASSEPERE